ncbi:MAG: hypothetical protein GXP62_04520, partial [Oligoflexia bacterium]|nr:hypothetical protein [Oligoflexia bacterium]
MLVTSLILALSTPALAGGSYSSDSQHFILGDSANVFQKTEYDTDWLPTGSPVQVRFQIAGMGSADVVMEGDADLWWPTDLNLGFFPEPDSGALTVDSNLEAVTSVKFDIFGYTWEQVIDSRTLADVVGDAVFTPFVLDDSAQDRVEIVNDDGAVEVVSYSLDVFAGVGLTLSATIGPQAIVGFEGLGWQTDDSFLETEAGTLSYAALGQAVQDVAATFIAAWDATLSIIITPSVDLDAGILGSYTVVEFEIPITLSSTSFEQEFPTTDLSFPLPVLATDIDSYDFGELTVDELANLNMAIYNDGELNLEGAPALTGSSYFMLYPNYFQASPGSEDGLVVTFAPESAGSFEASLLLTSNDPYQPAKEILLTGTAVDPPVIDDPTDGGTADGDTGSS